MILYVSFREGSYENISHGEFLFAEVTVNAAFAATSFPESPFPVKDGGDLVFEVSTETRMASPHPECPTRLQGRDSTPETASHPPAEAHGRDQVHSSREGHSCRSLPSPNPASPGGDTLMIKVYSCSTAQEQENALMLLLKRDLKKLFQDSKMVAVVQNNASNSEDMMLLKNRLFKHGILVKFFPNQVTRSFLMDSAYSNMAPLFIGPTVLFVSKEPKVKEMLKALRSSPQMTLLGACIDDTLLSVDGIVSYSKLPSMAVVQGQLVSGLTMLTSHTASLLQRHPAHLSALLQQHIRQQSPDSGAAEEAT